MAEFQIRIRRDLKRLWEETNPVLTDGEPGYELDTRRFKIGDGATRWTDLPYFSPNDAEATTLFEHINSETPHPVYDDGPSLLLLYENAKV